MAPSPLLDAMGVGLMQVRTDGCVHYANPRAATLLGRDGQQLVGLHLSELAHPDDAAGLMASVERVLEGQDAGGTRDTRWLRPHGDVAHLSLNLRPVMSPRPAHDGSPVVIGLALVLDDIGERVQMAEMLGAARQADLASRAKTEFLSRMSHELRTPLNAMLGFAQLLRADPRQPLNPAQRQKVEHIERAGAHLLAMLSDVLDLSRIEAGAMPLHLQHVDVPRLVDDVLSLVHHQAEDARLQLSAHVAEGLVVHPGLPTPPLTVVADPVRLRQVLVNLLSNAIKYNRPGGLVRLEVMPVDGEVMFNIADTGPGMTPDQIAHLFEPFNRLGAERSGVEGTGIGLVIVKRLTELMRGRVDVSSVPGTGTSFKVWLAREGLRGQDIQLSATADTLDDCQEQPLDARRPALETDVLSVLYAEDNLINIELVRQVMRMRPQWQLEVALCGQQAIDMACQRPPDLLLLDMHLPDMDGLDVLAALRADATLADVPVLAVSADATTERIGRARAAGVNGYVTKPIDVPLLLAQIEQLI